MKLDKYIEKVLVSLQDGVEQADRKYNNITSPALKSVVIEVNVDTVMDITDQVTSPQFPGGALTITIDISEHDPVNKQK